MSELRRYLLHHGWRKIGSQGGIIYWDHPLHQPNLRGAFTTVDAYNHQRKAIKKGQCNCIKPEHGL